MATRYINEKVLERKPDKLKSIEIWDNDTPGFGLRISPRGKRTWMIIARTEAGNPRRLSFGHYPGTGLKDARARAKELLALAAAGHPDPVAELRRIQEAEREEQARRESEAKAREAARVTVSQLLNRYEAAETGTLRAGSLKERMRVLRKDLAGWADRKAEDITEQDARQLLAEVEKRGVRIRNLLAAYLSRLWSFAKGQGIIASNPLTGLNARRGERRLKERPRKRFLTAEEIRALWRGLDEDSRVETVTKLALRFVLATGQRPVECSGAAWAEFDKHLTTWTVPAERRKVGDVDDEGGLVIPISPIAQDILKRARALNNEGCEFVFESPRKPKRAIRRDSMSQAILRLLPDLKVDDKPMAPFTPNDLRRSCRTHLSRIGVDTLAAERVLGHSLKALLGRIAATYDWHDDIPRKREALNRWSDELRRIVSLPDGSGGQPVDENVVALNVNRVR